MDKIPYDNNFTQNQSELKTGQFMVGEVTEIQPENATVTVKDLATNGMTFGPLSVVQMGTKEGGGQSLPAVGAVVVWLAYTYKQGVVLGRLLQGGDGQADLGDVVYFVRYSDGKGMRWDRTTNTLTVSADIVKIGDGATEMIPKGNTLVSKLEDLIDLVTGAQYGLHPGPMDAASVADLLLLKGELSQILSSKGKVE